VRLWSDTEDVRRLRRVVDIQQSLGWRLGMRETAGQNPVREGEAMKTFGQLILASLIAAPFFGFILARTEEGRRWATNIGFILILVLPFAIVLLLPHKQTTVIDEFLGTVLTGIFGLFFWVFIIGGIVGWVWGKIEEWRRT
jgi:hypothetical protein